MTSNFLAGFTAVVTFVFVFYLLRRGILREKYAVLWLFFSSAALFFAIFPSVLDRISFAIGVAAPVNLLFFVTVVLLILVSVQLSYELSRHEGRIRRLAEEVALLQQQINSLGEKDENESNGDH
jgi:hypothetical protein